MIAILALAAGSIYRLGFLAGRRAERPAPKKYAAAPVVKKRKADLPDVVKKFKTPKVAVVMDDFGYNVNNLDTLFDIKEPVTLSILPDLRYSSEISRLARLRGYEVILHLPLESHRKDVREEADTIRSGMSEKDVIVRLEKEIASVPGISGVSNHMGSKATEDKELMAVIFRQLKKRRLYFFDSLTSEKSVCREMSAACGIRFARRDVFLDNSNNPDDIKKQLLELRELAFKRGRAIAICHDRKNTITVLSRMMPAMTDDGIRFVSLSEMEK